MNSRKYRYLIGAALPLLVVAAAVILFKMQRLQKLRPTAVSTFYAMKSLEVRIGALDQARLAKGNPIPAGEIQAGRDKVRSLEGEYRDFLKELDLYAKASPEDRVIMRVARSFGECELNMPKSFPGQVKEHIARWKSSDRLQKALSRARAKGYPPLIAKILKENDLPPQYFFVALQESNFNARALGPATPFGAAKGLWQFIAPTAKDFGLRVGPHHDQPVYDPRDERFNPVRSTVAAAKYLRSLYCTYAEASGMLVLALYNMGEGNIRKIIDQMPPNPRERNFWRLLSMKGIPEEIYDYVLSVVSAAVICEDPKLFGFDCDCPAFESNLPARAGS